MGGTFTHRLGLGEPAFWQRSVITTIRTTVGSQDITAAGLSFTPKLAIFVFSDVTAVDTKGAQAADGSYGMADGTNQFVTNFNTRDSGANYRRTATDEVLMITTSGVGVIAEADFTNFIPGGVRINIGANTLANSYVVSVHLFGGTSLSAEVGTFDTSTSPVTVTTGWRPEAMMFSSPWSDPFDDTGDTGLTWCNAGFASYDGTTLRQCASSVRTDNTANTRGGVVSTAPILVGGLGGAFAEAQITAIDDTGFTVTRSDTIYSGYCAMNFGGAVEAWAGVVDAPTATGLQNITGASFTPECVFIMPTMAEAAGTLYTDGRGATWGMSSANASGDETANSWRSRDGAAGASSTAYEKFLNHEDHLAAVAFDATYNSMVSGGVRANYATANGTLRKFAALMIG